METQTKCVSGSHTWNFWLKELELLKKETVPVAPRVATCMRERLDFSHLVPGAYLTHQETRCIRELLAGKTIKQAAVAMQLSHRSVEFYFNNIKKKFGVKKKKLLLALIKDSGVL